LCNDALLGHKVAVGGEAIVALVFLARGGVLPLGGVGVGPAGRINKFIAEKADGGGVDTSGNAIASGGLTIVAEVARGTGNGSVHTPTGYIT